MADLAADNLVVRPDGSIALVDLDTASWPSLVAAPPMSEGTPGYVHPRGAPLDPARRDRFPALVIWASLRILARHPNLRERWGDRPDQYGGVLLWSTDDLRRSARAPLFAALDALQASDEVLVPLLEVIRRAIHFPADETPPLSEVAERLEGLGFPRLAGLGSGSRGDGRTPLEMPPTRRTVLDRDSTEGEWHGRGHQGISKRRTRRTLSRNLAHHDPLGTGTPPGHGTRTGGSYRRARYRHRRGTLGNVPHRTRDGDLCRSRTSARSTRGDGAIERALRRKDDDGLVAAVAEAERVGVAPSAEARTAVRAARQRIATRMALREAIGRGDFHALAALACSGNSSASAVWTRPTLVPSNVRSRGPRSSVLSSVMTTSRLPWRSIRLSGERRDRCLQRHENESTWRGVAFAGWRRCERRCDDATTSSCAVC
jgi:hypothetical protein